jgi:DNA mismatch endonuclease (patch repair protein)
MGCSAVASLVANGAAKPSRGNGLRTDYLRGSLRACLQEVGGGQRRRVVEWTRRSGGRVTDVFSPAKRSWVMSRVRSKDTAPEKVLRRLLRASGHAFRTHEAHLVGCPDLVIPKLKTVIFVHGCFWHGHTRCTKGTRRPRANAAFWRRKLEENLARDKTVARGLRRAGWHVLTVWECETKNLNALKDRLRRRLERRPGR